MKLQYTYSLHKEKKYLKFYEKLGRDSVYSVLSTLHLVNCISGFPTNTGIIICAAVLGDPFKPIVTLRRTRPHLSLLLTFGQLILSLISRKVGIISIFKHVVFKYFYTVYFNFCI